MAIPMPAPNVLPSDSRNREDLTWLKKQDVSKAETWKLWLEEQQRHEEKIRKRHKWVIVEFFFFRIKIYFINQMIN